LEWRWRASSTQQEVVARAKSAGFLLADGFSGRGALLLDDK
jgi:hypothetical protein